MSKESPLPKRLKQARLRAGLSQRELGMRAGMDEFSASSRMSQYETAVHAPDYDVAHRIAEQLNVPACYLFCDDDDLANVVTAYYQSSENQKQAVKNELQELLVAESPSDYSSSKKDP